jgi:hypothetical protein
MCRVIEHQTRLYGGYAIKFHCSQDEAHKKASKKAKDPVKWQDRLPMKRFLCNLWLHLSLIRSHTQGPFCLQVTFRHSQKHYKYERANMDADAVDVIRDNLLTSTPTALVTTIQLRWPHITAAQVQNAWVVLSLELWRRDDDLIESACRLLQEMEENGEADYFNLKVDKGVQAVAWGLPKLMKEKLDLIEIAMDATCTLRSRVLLLILKIQQILTCLHYLPSDKTNREGLELYGLIAKQASAGVPIGYCLLSTATTISKDKCKRALAAFLMVMRKKYGLNPDIFHTNKGFAKIGAHKLVWPNAVHQICAWHRDCTVGERLSKNKLSTVTYNSAEVIKHYGYSFVDPEF